MLVRNTCSYACHEVPERLSTYNLSIRIVGSYIVLPTHTKGTLESSRFEVSQLPTASPCNEWVESMKHIYVHFQ